MILSFEKHVKNNLILNLWLPLRRSIFIFGFFVFFFFTFLLCCKLGLYKGTIKSKCKTNSIAYNCLGFCCSILTLILIQISKLSFNSNPIHLKTPIIN